MLPTGCSKSLRFSVAVDSVISNRLSRSPLQQDHESNSLARGHFQQNAQIFGTFAPLVCEPERFNVACIAGPYRRARSESHNRPSASERFVTAGAPKHETLRDRATTVSDDFLSFQIAVIPLLWVMKKNR